jgi:hypothetical protein
MDDLFVSTWQQAKGDLVNNIIAAIPVFEALKAAGCLVAQVGGDSIKRDIYYGVGSKTYITKGSVLPIETPELMTQATWNWRYFAAAITRNIIEDQQNSGEAARRNLVATRLEAARRACIEGIETDLFGVCTATASSPYEAGISAFQGLNELVPPYGYYNYGYYGGIARASPNTWWNCKMQALSSNPEVTLIDDMQQLYMAVSANMEAPNLIIASENLFRIYLSFGLNMSQIVKDEGGRLVDLGYEVARFNGKPMIYQDLVKYNDGGAGSVGAIGTDDTMLMLNTNYIELVHDPNMWFDISEWKRAPRDPNAVAHILCCLNLITTQPRRHGRLYTT